MRKPLALVVALLVLAPALAFAAPAAARPRQDLLDRRQDRRGRARQTRRHGRGPEVHRRRRDPLRRRGRRRARLLDHRAAAIGRANLNGGGLGPGLHQRRGPLWGVAVDGAHVYWSSYGIGAIGRAKLDGTGVEPQLHHLRAGATRRWRSTPNTSTGPYQEGQDRARQARRTHGDRRFIPHRGRPGRGCGRRPTRLLVHEGRIGRANRDGTHVDKRFITRVGDLRNCGRCPARLLVQDGTTRSGAPS